MDKTKTKVLFASDLDRTIIYSSRFLKEYGTEAERTPVEFKEDKIISYIADSVKEGLTELINTEGVEFVPVTTRSYEEYNRIKFGFTPKYAIIDNGGRILVDGAPILSYETYIQHMASEALRDTALVLLDITEHKEIIDREPKFVDNLFLFWKVKEGTEKMADVLINVLNEAYPHWRFTRQKLKMYGVPMCFSKQTALRWLWNQLNKPHLVVSGDGELDLPMLTLANKAIIPSHSDLLRDGFVESADVANGGIESPLKAISYIKKFIQA